MNAPRRDVLVLLKNRDTGGLVAHLAGAECSSKKAEKNKEKDNVVAEHWWVESDGSDEPQEGRPQRRVVVMCARTWDDFRLLDPTLAAFSSPHIQTLAAKLTTLLLPWTFTQKGKHLIVILFL
jgi:hypothetical protein